MGRVDRAAKLFYSKPMNFISIVKLAYKNVSDICLMEEDIGLKDCVQNCKIKLIDVRRLNDGQINSLSTEVKFLFCTIQHV